MRVPVCSFPWLGTAMLLECLDGSIKGVYPSPRYCTLPLSYRSHDTHDNSYRVSLAMSCLAFLTTIWGEGVVFTWFLNLVGISALLVWASIGCISIRFRYAWSIQGRSLRDLPFVQPLFPLLPVVTIVLALLMFAGEGYAAVVTAPFDWRVSASSNPSALWRPHRTPETHAWFL